MTIAEQLHDDHLRRNLALVRAGVKNRAAGIRRCRDCHEPFIGSTSLHPWCEECKPRHQLICGRCTTPYPVDENPRGLCPTCRVHPSLFGEDSE